MTTPPSPPPPGPRRERARPDAPDAATRAWVEREVRAGAVVGVRRLTGGIATSTHLLTFESGHQVVLRRHHRTLLAEEPGAVANEVATLRHVAGRGVPTPVVVAADVDGSAAGTPALVMERLPGRIELSPRHRDGWLRQMAEALGMIHEMPPLPASMPVAAAPDWLRRAGPPTWSAHRELWERAIDVVWDGDGPTSGTGRAALVHGDFQHFNLLWSRGRLTGVVDWSGDSGNPLDADLGHCRLNLVILFGTEVADDFLRCYQSVTGRTVDPWWDLRETVVFLPTWAPTILRQVGARLPVDVEAMHRRVDAHLSTLLARL